MLPSDAAAVPIRPAAWGVTGRRGAPWLGRDVPFRLEATDDPVFDRRLIVTGRRSGWLVLSYHDTSLLAPRRPVVRVLRGAGTGPEDFVLPGAAHGRAHWLGLIPPDAQEIRFSAAPGLVLERVGTRRELGVLAQCLLRRPWRAVAALYERLRGSERRYRDILRGACAVTPLAAYPAWAAARRSAVPVAGSGLRIRCVIPARPDEAPALTRTLDALQAQTHASFTATVAWAGSPPASRDSRARHGAWDPAIAATSLLDDADALCLLRPGDVLAPDALAALGNALSGADGAYGDDIGAGDRPRLKPDWSPDLALAAGYPGRPMLVARSALAEVLPGRVGSPADVFARLPVGLVAARARMAHVPRILARTADEVHDPFERVRILEGEIRARSLPVRATLRDGSVDLVWPLPSPSPRVSVVIPSRDRLDLITRVCRGVLHETAYAPIELIIVDNGSIDPAVRAHYDRLREDARVRILDDPRPFNFAAMVNAGVAAASGAVVALLNNDVAVLQPGWLDAMVRQACRPEVGAVGAKLLYADGTLQHAGVVVGLGGRAGHILRRRPGDAPGHLGQLRVAHEVSAVTAACLVVTRDKYRAVGGFDAEAFPVDFNDVDFCLRLGAAGWKTVWTPAATLAHLESVSRGPATGAKRVRFEQEAARFSERWRDVIRHDPFYHPALSLTTFGEDLE
jgi:O-antigen biosynthesis protein